jgi:hypothetical protein
LIYVDGGRVAEYATWVRTLDFVAVTDADLDNDTESALKQFEQNNNKQAISDLWRTLPVFQEEYILYRLISTWRKHTEGLETKSIPNYEYVIGQPRSEFTEQS